MQKKQKFRAAATALCLCGVLAGCQHKSTTKNNAKTTSSTSKDQGKTYVADKKSAGATGGSSESGDTQNAPLPSPADTVNYKASAASDDGDVHADNGEPVMNPGAPLANPPARPSRAPKH